MAYKKSTWREQRVQVKPNTLKAVYFNDTQPNHMLFSNPSPHQLFVSVSSTVSDTTFDMIVPAYGTRLYPREIGVREVYLYHNGATTFNMTVTSWEGEFNPSSIAQSQEIVTAAASGMLGTVDINYILNPLPAGTNKIGVVAIDQLPNVNVAQLPSLPAGVNNIGSVNVAQLPSLPAGVNNIGAVDVDFTNVLTELVNIKNQVAAVKNYPFTIKTYGLSTDVKPAAPAVGDSFLAIDTKEVSLWDGAQWVVW